MAREKPTLKFPAGKVVDLAPYALRVQGLIKKAAEVCKGEDPLWDAWMLRHLAAPDGALNGLAGLPLATDAYMRGLHEGLKAHIPIESEQFAAKRNEFAARIARAMIRYGVVEATSKIVAKTDGCDKDVLEMCGKIDAAFKRLEELKGEPAPAEHPLVKAQRVMGEKIVDVRTTKNRPELPDGDRQESERTFRLLQQLYLEMFGALFPG